MERHVTQAAAIYTLGRLTEEMVQGDTCEVSNELIISKFTDFDYSLEWTCLGGQVISLARTDMIDLVLGMEKALQEVFDEDEAFVQYITFLDLLCDKAEEVLS